jgi:hypothetical protein
MDVFYRSNKFTDILVTRNSRRDEGDAAHDKRFYSLQLILQQRKTGLQELAVGDTTNMTILFSHLLHRG